MRLSSLLALPLVLSVGVPAYASDAPSDAEVSRRLDFIEARLGRASGGANLWWNSWYLGWTALTTGQFVIALATSDAGTRKDMAVGAAASSLAVIPLGILPFPAKTAARDLARFPGHSTMDRRRKLLIAERLLKSAADDEKLRRSWVNHATSIGVSIGVGVLLGVGYDRPLSGFLNALGGIALSEIQIWTTPTAAIADFAEYQSFRRTTGNASFLPGARHAKPALRFSVAPGNAGMAIVGHF